MFLKQSETNPSLQFQILKLSISSDLLNFHLYVMLVLF